MAAPKKITPEMEAEILRRRAAREPIVSIAADFEIAHQTVSKLAKRDTIKRAAELERQAQAAARAERDGRQEQTVRPAMQTVRDPLLPAVFKSRDQRLDYYEYHQLDSYPDKLNYNDALHGRETPAERSLLNRGSGRRGHRTLSSARRWRRSL